MFPDYLDGAKVPEYTERGNYAKTINPWADGISPTRKTVCYAAICQYDSESSYYIFWCDGDYNVMQDWCCIRSSSARGST